MKMAEYEKFMVHDDTSIRGFFGEYRWLSNFHTCYVYYEGLLYNSSEAAYQAAKLLPHYRPSIVNMSAAAKGNWNSLGEDSLYDQSPEDWNNRRYEVMLAITFDKYFRNKGIRKKLIDTGDKYLEELNCWNDSYWGVDTVVGGQNNLGKILMRVRSFWLNANAVDKPESGM